MFSDFWWLESPQKIAALPGGERTALSLKLRKLGLCFSMAGQGQPHRSGESTGSNSRWTPRASNFDWVIKRFLKSQGHTMGMMPPGMSPPTEQDINLEKVFMKQKKRVSIRGAASPLDMSIGKIWKILRVHLKWFPYKPKTVQTLTEDHKEQRRNACSFFTLKDRK